MRYDDLSLVCGPSLVRTRTSSKRKNSRHVLLALVISSRQPLSPQNRRGLGRRLRPPLRFLPLSLLRSAPITWSPVWLLLAIGIGFCYLWAVGSACRWTWKGQGFVAWGLLDGEGRGRREEGGGARLNRWRREIKSRWLSLGAGYEGGRLVRRGWSCEGLPPCRPPVGSAAAREADIQIQGPSLILRVQVATVRPQPAKCLPPIIDLRSRRQFRRPRPPKSLMR